MEHFLQCDRPWNICSTCIIRRKIMSVKSPRAAEYHAETAEGRGNSRRSRQQPKVAATAEGRGNRQNR
jgi:hypothetical protein